MSVPLIVIGASIAISAAASVYAILSASKQKKSTLSPQTLDSFGVTQAKEGSVIPLIYGRVRLPGNLIYYGNLVTEEITAEAQGGSKGFGGMGGGGDAVTGYRYYLDVWETIGLGKLNLVSAYLNDNELTIDAAETLFNDGENGVYPSAYVADSNQLKGISHVFYRRLFLGNDTTQVPTIHFVVERVLNTGLPNENLSNGNNPAAIIYDLLVQAKIPTNQIDSASFQVASTFWATKGYGLNFIFSEQKKLYDNINTVLSQVDGVFYINEAGKYAIKPYDPDQIVVKSLSTLDLYEFSMQRLSYSQLPNDLRAEYVDSDLDFTERIANFQNPAAIQAVGRVISKSFDLKGFRTLEGASKRLAEIGKYTTYPVAKTEFSTNFKYASLQPGDVVEISYSDLGIASSKFRIDTVDTPSLDSLLVKFKATQVAEILFDENFSNFGGGNYTRAPLVPSAFPKRRIEFILPYNPITKAEENLCFLIEREKNYENGYLIQARTGEPPALPYLPGSDADAGYFNAGFLRGLSRFVNISVPVSYYFSPLTYPHFPCPFNPTYTIDDENEGITFFADSPLDLTLYPEISREELFTKNRFLFICALGVPYTEEFVAFQKIEAVTPPAGNTNFWYKITHFLRGALYTPKRTRGTVAPPPVTNPNAGFLFRLGENYLESERCGSYRVILPSTINESASPANAHPFFPYPYYSFNSLSPRNLSGGGRIEAVRVGSNIDVKFYPATDSFPGCGIGHPDEVTDSEIFGYLGTLFFQRGVTIVEKHSPEVTYSFSDPAAVILSVSIYFPETGKTRGGNIEIGISDGIYIQYIERGG